MFKMFCSTKIVLYWKIVLFSIIKSFNERKYYILAIYFYNKKKVLYKESIIFPKKVLKFKCYKYKTVAHFT